MYIYIYIYIYMSIYRWGGQRTSAMGPAGVLPQEGGGA